MYQSACCLVNWAEVSRRRVGAKQEEEGGKKQSSWSRRDRVCVVPALNDRHGYGGRGIGGGDRRVSKSSPPLLCGAMGKALICLHCAAKTSPPSDVRGLRRSAGRQSDTVALSVALSVCSARSESLVAAAAALAFSGLAASEGTFTMVARLCLNGPSKVGCGGGGGGGDNGQQVAASFKGFLRLLLPPARNSYLT